MLTERDKSCAKSSRPAAGTYGWSFGNIQFPHRRATELIVGFSTWKAADYAFDYGLYPFVIWKLGPLTGGMFMSGLSLIFCLLLLRLYDCLGRDWLGIEFLKNLRYYHGPSKLRRAVAEVISRGDVVAFLLLSAKYDPFVTTAYLRRGAAPGMVARDWNVFLASWLISNALWVLVCFGGTSAAKAIWLQASKSYLAGLSRVWTG